MTELGVKSPNVTASDVLDDVIGNRKGSTRRHPITALAKQLAGTSPINLLGNQAPLFKTRADLSASALATKISAWVYEDDMAANNGIWRWTGATWEWALPLPYSFLEAEDVGAGTANAIKATSKIPVSEESLVLVSLFRATTGEPATISFNDGDPLTIKTNRGTDASALTAGMVMAGKITGGIFRLITDEDVSAQVNQAEAARDAAVEAAETVSAGLDNRVRRTGDRMSGALSISGLANEMARIVLEENAVTRWALGKDADAGADFFLNRYDTAGALAERVLGVDRDTGLISHKGGYIRNADWFLNDVRNFGAVKGTAADQDAAFNAAKNADQIRLPRGGWRVSNTYDFSTSSIWNFDHGAYITDADGSPSPATIGGWLQFTSYINKGYDIEARSGGMIRSPTRKIKLSNADILTTGDEDITDDSQLYYQRKVTGSGLTGYNGGASMNSYFLAYGFAGAASGSVGINQARLNVYNAEDKGGRNEIIVDSKAIVNISGGVVNNTNQYVQDLVWSGPIDQQERFAAGITLGLKKLHSGQVSNANYNGAFGMTAETCPTMGGYGAPSLQNYPMDVGFAVSGWSGPASSVSGSDASADVGWKWAFFAGGRNGIWAPYGAISKIGRGMGIRDYTISGIEIFTAHPSASDPFAIKVFADAGRVTMGVNSPRNDAFMSIRGSSLQYGHNLHLPNSSFSGSQRAGILLNSMFIIGTSPGGDAVTDFFIARDKRSPSITITDAGENANPNVKMLLPTSATGLPSGALWVDTANARVLKQVA